MTVTAMLSRSGSTHARIHPGSAEMLDSFASERLVARVRVVVDAGLPMPADLARAVLVELESTQDARDRRLRRDQHIRRAALLIDSSQWARASALAKEALALDGVWSRLQHAVPEQMTVRGELHAAKLQHRLPSTARQFYSIIKR